MKPPVLSGSALLVLIVICHPQPARSEAGHANLQLRLQASAGKNQLPEVFTIELSNPSDHDVRLPLPAIQCEDSFNGSVVLGVRFRPLHPGDVGVDGGGCAGDRYGARPSILERVRDWKTLPGGETLTLKIDRTKAFLPSTGRPGTYTFRACYKPAAVNAVDRNLLSGSGIDFPGEPLCSAQITLVIDAFQSR
jgi:hypothetical protein